MKSRDTSQVSWQAWRALAPTPPVMALQRTLQALPADRWPTHDDWTHAARACGTRNLRGLAISFVPPSQPPPSALDFEQRICDRGEVETRAACWHDAFHACAWLDFPLTKARINALHLAHGADASPNLRGVVRNVLTLLDEGGLLVVSRAPELLDLVHGFRWHTLFWERRAAVRESMDFIILGHALYERTLNMEYGATGRALLFAADESYFVCGMAARLRWLDVHVAALLDDPLRLVAMTALQPLPINGIPGWNAENELEAYYFDQRQFSPGRRQAA